MISSSDFTDTRGSAVEVEVGGMVVGVLGGEDGGICVDVAMIVIVVGGEAQALRESAITRIPPTIREMGEIGKFFTCIAPLL